MEESVLVVFDEILKQQEQVNDDLIEFSDCLERLLVEKSQDKQAAKSTTTTELSSDHDPLISSLMSLFGLKKRKTCVNPTQQGGSSSITSATLVKPSFLFSNIPDLKRFVEFKHFYMDKTLNREHFVKASFGVDHVEEIINDNDGSRFITLLEQLLFTTTKQCDDTNPCDDTNKNHQLTELKTLYTIKQLISKHERKYHHLHHDDFSKCCDKHHVVNRDLLSHPNKPLLTTNDEQQLDTTVIHRIIVTRELFSPYELHIDNASTTTTSTTAICGDGGGAIKAFQIILHGNSKILRKRLSTLPLYSDLYSSIIGVSNKLPFSTLRSEIYPTPLSDIPNSSNPRRQHDHHYNEISMEQMEWLSTKYLPNIFRHRVEWENSLLKRSELIYKLLAHFTKQPSSSDERSGRVGTHNDHSWSTIICSQYPVLLKRNGQYMLAFGIRWNPFTMDISNTIQSLKKKGLYGLEFNTEHFNNFPYFFKEDGSECIVTKRPNITSTTNGGPTLLGNFKDHLKCNIISRSGTGNYSLPKYPPLRHWIFDHFFNQSRISSQDFASVMEGRRSLFEIILKYSPDLIMENQHLNQTLTTKIAESLKFSKRDHHSPNTRTINDLKSIQLLQPDFSRHTPLFLPFYFHINELQIYRIDHSFSHNIVEYCRFLVDALSDLTASYIDMADLTLLDLLEIREFLQEKFRIDIMPSRHQIPIPCWEHADTVEKFKGHNIMDVIPNLIETVRYNMKHLRLDNLYFKLYLRGLYVPENPLLHRDFIQHQVKKFLTKLKSHHHHHHHQENDDIHSRNEHVMKDKLTLLSRFLNLKWKKPLSYVQVMTPSTRAVIRKLVNTYLIPLKNVLLPTSSSSSNRNSVVKTLINNYIPFQSKPSTDLLFSISLLDTIPSSIIVEEQYDQRLSENVREFIGKYQHDTKSMKKSLKSRLFVLFLMECSLRNIDISLTEGDEIRKLAVIFNNAHDSSSRFPNFSSIESEIVELWHSHQHFEEEPVTNYHQTFKLYPLTVSSTLLWRSNFRRDVSQLRLLVWNQLSRTPLLLLGTHPINLIISNSSEKYNRFIWNNILEQSFDMLLLENIKNVTSFFPVNMGNNEEEKEWSIHYKKLQKLGGDWLQYYPSRSPSPISVPSLYPPSKRMKLEERVDILDMFFHIIDMSNSNSRLVVDNSINSLSLTENSSVIMYNRQFGFLYDNLLVVNNGNNQLKNTNSQASTTTTDDDDWDLNLKMKCMSRRILRKLRQTTSSRRDILGRNEINILESTNEILECSRSIIDYMGKHSKRDVKLLQKLERALNDHKQRNTSITTQDLMEQVIKFCMECEVSRISQEKVSDSPQFILSPPKEQTSYCPDRTTRETINSNELYSLVPFIGRNLTRSKSKEIILSSCTEKYEDVELFPNQSNNNHHQQQQHHHHSDYSNYLEKEIHKIKENGFENSFKLDKIIDYSYILSYGKVKLLFPNHYDECFNSVFITEAEAAYMNQQQRPLFYKSSDVEWDLANKEFPTHAICENIDKLEQLALEGVDGRMVFGGFCGGHCELLLLHPDCEELKSGLDTVSNLKEMLANRKIEFFGEVSCGWMNIDDVVGPGIEISTESSTEGSTKNNSSAGDTTRDNIWIANECCTFEYNPRKTLEENNKERKEKQKKRGGLKYVSHPKRFDQLESYGHHHLRETIPLYDLQFLFYSATPFNFTDFCDDKQK